MQTNLVLRCRSALDKHTNLETRRQLEDDLLAASAREFFDVWVAVEGCVDTKHRMRAATNLFIIACQARTDLTFDMAFRCGMQVQTLVKFANTAHVPDLPPTAELAAELCAALLSKCQLEQAGRMKSGEAWCRGCGMLIAVKAWRLEGQLAPETVESLLSHALQPELGWLTVRQVLEAGELVPSWRKQILHLLLVAAEDRLQEKERGSFAISLRSLARVAQTWGSHEDCVMFSRLRRLHDLEDQEAPERASPVLSTEKLPVLELSHEVVVVVDCMEGESALENVAQRVSAATAANQHVRLSMDAEWRDPRPLSLLQMAVCVSEGTTEIFLIDFLAPLQEKTLRLCRELLRPAENHQVFVFSPKEDRRRLGAAGVLPPVPKIDACETSVDDEGWTDLQRVDWGLGAQPSLQAIVRQEMGFFMDKRLQTSDWDCRPLSLEQVNYAALDASVLLQLAKCQGSRQCISEPASTPTLGKPECVTLTLEEEKRRWKTFRQSSERSRTRVFKGNARELNSDLVFLLPSSLVKLMRQMRGVGLDTLILQERATARELVTVAVNDDRVFIIPSSSKLQVPSSALHRLYRLTALSLEDQLQEIIQVFDAVVDAGCLCGRCVQCNAWEWVLLSREEVRGNPQVKDKTLEKYDEFWRCGGCDKIYYKGDLFKKATAHFGVFMTS